MERSLVVSTVLQASTLEECRHARGVLAQWMQAHPDDYGMLDAGESLEMSCGEMSPIAALPEPRETAVI